MSKPIFWNFQIRICFKNELKHLFQIRTNESSGNNWKQIWNYFISILKPKAPISGEVLIILSRPVSFAIRIFPSN